MAPRRPLFSTAYDELFAEAARTYLPFLDHGELWLKAQGQAESGLNPLAVSPAGAEGLMQIMPTTWPEIRDAIGAPADATPFEPRWAIPGAAWYDRRMWNAWRTPRAQIERVKLMFASYNAGLGNLFKAQDLADGATLAAPILDHLAQVTGEKNANETRGYVRRIERFYGQLLLQG